MTYGCSILEDLRFVACRGGGDDVPASSGGGGDMEAEAGELEVADKHCSAAHERPGVECGACGRQAQSRGVERGAWTL
jgi:hypothetical protein